MNYLKIIFTFSSQNKSCSKAKTLQLCFRLHSQIPNRFWNTTQTIYRFLNKSILGNLVQKSISQFLWLQKNHKITLKYSNTHFNLIWIFHNFWNKHNIFSISNSPEIKHIKSHFEWMTCLCDAMLDEDAYEWFDETKCMLNT